MKPSPKRLKPTADEVELLSTAVADGIDAEDAPLPASVDSLPRTVAVRDHTRKESDGEGGGMFDAHAPSHGGQDTKVLAPPPQRGAARR